jgi:putative membrane protein
LEGVLGGERIVVDFGVRDLPTLNAALNAASALLLAAAYHAIRRREIVRHRRLMLTAVGTSAVFLVSYLVYHAQVGSVRFTGQGPVRTLYFAILISHTILAALIVPLVLRTLYLALHARFEEHRRAARWTFPIWMYVSVTGVVIYTMLYRIRW